MKKFLLVAMSTVREVEGEPKKVRFPAGKVADLNKAELAMLDKLTLSTGKLHYRDPKDESASADDEEGNDDDQFLGESVVIGKKNVDQLKAYLTFHEVAFADDADKAALVKAVKGHADPDAGL